MRILLINPDKFRKILFKKFSLPCLGLGYLASQAEQAGHTVQILDMNVEPTGLKNIERLLHEYDPHVIGITSTLFTTSETVAVASIIKDLVR